MKRQLTPAEAEIFLSLAAQARAVEDALAALTLATLRSGLPDKEVIPILDWIDRTQTFKGISYFLTPQTEWTGGDSSDPANFKVMSPHIIEKVPA